MMSSKEPPCTAVSFILGASGSIGSVRARSLARASGRGKSVWQEKRVSWVLGRTCPPSLCEAGVPPESPTRRAPPSDTKREKLCVLRQRDRVSLRLREAWEMKGVGERAQPASGARTELLGAGGHGSRGFRTQKNLHCAVLGWMVIHPLDVPPSASNLQ